jgi:hypothetical protein
MTIVATLETASSATFQTAMSVAAKSRRLLTPPTGCDLSSARRARLAATSAATPLSASTERMSGF